MYYVWYRHTSLRFFGGAASCGGAGAAGPASSVGAGTFSGSGEVSRRNSIAMMSVSSQSASMWARKRQPSFSCTCSCFFFVAAPRRRHEGGGSGGLGLLYSPLWVCMHVNLAIYPLTSEKASFGLYLKHVHTDHIKSTFAVSECACLSLVSNPTSAELRHPDTKQRPGPILLEERAGRVVALAREMTDHEKTRQPSLTRSVTFVLSFMYECTLFFSIFQ